MLERKDLIVPTFNYQLRTDKPPLHYYFMMLGYSLFGVNEFSARFFSSLFGAFTVLTTFLFGRRYFGEKTAFLSFIVLVSSLHLSIQFHMAVPDPYLIFWINGGLFSFFYGFVERKRLFIYLFYLFMGLGVLTKGPVAVVLPMGIVFLYLFLSNSLSRDGLRFIKPFTGLLITAMVSLPWYVAVYIKTDGRWVYEFLFKHNIHRFSQPMEGHGGIFLITFLFVFAGLLPFSVFILQALKNAWREKYRREILFLLVFAGVYVLFFAVSKTKLPNYTVPAYPPLALVLAYYLSRINLSSLKGLYASVVFYVLLTVVVVAGLYYALKNEPAVSDLAHLSFWFFLLTIGGLAGLFFLVRRQFEMFITSLSISSVLMSFLFFYVVFPPVDGRNPVQQMLPLIHRESPVRYYKSFNPAFVFYLRKEIKPLKKDGIKPFFSREERVYVLTRKRYLKDFEGVENAYLLKVVKDLFENKVSALLSNRK
ncbi:MAG: glycosyltransferase family 39 protein [Aquificae bacterium]|nr:glycosyltransferase family 39 protein [Aquificota bacterium]